MIIEFDTREYEFCHGIHPDTCDDFDAPWAFRAEGETEWLISPSLPYPKACEWAMDQRPDATDFAIGS